MPDPTPDPRELSRRGFLRGSLAAVFTPTLLGCGGEPVAPYVRNARISARPGPPSESPTLGRSPLGLESPRDGFLYVPETYDPSRAWPLLVTLHGAGGNAENWQGFLTGADEYGLVLLAVDARASTWDVVRAGFGPDVDFIDRALAHVFRRCLIDPAAICLAGFSDGASYALSLGLSNGDVFPHLLAWSPGFMAPAEPRVGRPRVWVSHGRQDTILPVRLSRDGIVPSLTADGYDVTYREFDGGHEVPRDIARGGLDWFVD